VNAATAWGRLRRQAGAAAFVVAALHSAPVARAGELGDVDNLAAPYLQRTDSIAAGAGNAKAVNSVTHVIDPWPPYAGNRRIPGDGERMTGAIERYRDVSKLLRTPPTLSHPMGAQAGSAAGAPAASTPSATTSITGQ